MTVFRNMVVSGFVQISNSLLNDPSLSWKAKGILSYLISKPPTWNANPVDIERHATDGSCSVRSGLNELEVAGYIVRGQERDDTGKFIGYAFDVYDSPRSKENRTSPLERSRSSVPQEPVIGKPNNGKQLYSNTECSNTETNNTEECDIKEEKQETDSDGEALFNELFGAEPEPGDSEKIDWSDKDVRDARLLTASRKYLEGAGEKPWIGWGGDHIKPRGGIEADDMRRVGWIIQSITGIKPQSASMWKLWRPVYEDTFREAHADFDIIRDAVEGMWAREEKYRPSVPSKITAGVAKFYADTKSAPSKQSSRKISEM